MKKLYRILIWFILVVTILIIKTLIDAGEFKTIEPHFDGNIEPISGAIGAEDITILSNGIALISSDDRRKTLAGTPEQGAIFGYDLRQENPRLFSLTAHLKFDFNPHGISVYESENGLVTVGVVNHTKEADLIELFDLVDGLLIHRQSLSDPIMISPNDLVLVNTNQFYVTNDHGNTSELGRTIEEYLQLARSNMLFFDGEKFTVAASELGYANGINISQDGKTLFVAETVGKKMSLYNRNLSTNTLTFSHAIDFNSGVDNIELDAEGNVWIGSHPKMLAFTRHAKNAIALSPSQVFRVTQPASDHFQIEEIFLDLGNKLSGSSVAATYGNTLLIGSVFEDHFLHCKFLPN
ncbi:MAG: hypothetical protein HOD97_04645 [Candidatus Marinimicrobia bacterium]|jgi:arylesterase/paraoxonase|nr:hypothetical protein [Candidatus Neomarinimicrobiota bacterium]MBT3618144.1 hypothetical protein [Candidatus Neomarinimicrobiota bacterium]MBT3828615.1 hypothetical protein [Candidatus Neomarinimicrobiota bacterium]MBT3996923.1 hypothetical protein [Candidatus Neomarinimicrobiota bacterium]MBT4280887.1 hypothetical protein [Candidatus Neomarinimicrobiota bacterium]